MDITGEYRIPAPRQQVWEALNDAEVLKASIPGCEELIKKSDTELEAKVRAKVGPVSARFGGAVTLGDLNPPESYTISGQGSGGAAGFAKGGAAVHLTEDGAVTVLRYDAKAEVGGKLAQIGSRLIQGAAHKMAEEFFGNFTRIVTERAQGATAAPPAIEAAQAAAAAPPAATTPTPRAPEPAPAYRPSLPPLPPEPRRWSQSPLAWLVGVIVFLLLLFWFYS